MANSFSIEFPNTFSELEALFLKLQRAQSAMCLTTAGLVIKAGASALVKAGTVVYAYVEGTLVTKAANTDMAALSGTVTADMFNVFVFTITSGGTLGTQMGTEATTLGGVVFPTIAEGKAVIGFVIINPTGTGNFVGGTTALDDATVVPTAVYVNTPYPFLPGMQVL